MNNSNERAKLLYSVKEYLSSKDDENQDQSVTINDILKSVQILEDADKTVNNKRNKTNFGSISNQFIKLSSLNSFKEIPLNVLKQSFPDMPSYSTKDPQNDLSKESRTGNQANFKNFPLIKKLNNHHFNENNDKSEIYKNCELQKINSKDCKQIINSDENVNNQPTRHIGDIQEEMYFEKKKLPKDRCGLNSVSEGTLQNCSNELVHQQILAVNHENQSDIFEKDNKQLTQKNVWDTTRIENSEQLPLGTLTTNDEKVWNNDILHQEKLPPTTASTSEENYIIKDKNVEGHAQNSSPLKVEDELYGFTYTQLFNDDLTYFMNNLEEQNSAKPNEDKCSGPLEVLSRNKEKYINLTQPMPNIDVFCDTSEKQKLSFIQRSEPMDDDITSVLPQVGNKTITKLAYDEATVLNPKREVFSTASGKKVLADSKSLDKVRLLFTDDAENSKAFVANKKEKLQKNCPEDAKIRLEESKNMYTIASGKSVDEKENESSDKVSLLLKDYVNDTGDCLVSEKDNYQKNMFEQHEESKITALSFTTAAGKSVKIDSKNLDKVRLLFNDDLESALHLVDHSKSSFFQQLQKETEPFSFSTDKAKSVEVNFESLDEARLLLNQSPEIMKVNKNCSLIKNVLEQKQLPISKSTPFTFSTAGGKSVKIDSKSLDKARLLFDDDKKDNLIIKACHNNTNLLKLDNHQLRKETKLFGFSTARGKPVEVESKSLEHVKLLFNDDSKDIEAVTSMIDDTWLADSLEKGSEKEFEMKGFSKSTPLLFSTALGKLVEVESKSVDKVRMLFSDDIDNKVCLKDAGLLKNVKFERAQRQDIEQGGSVKSDNESSKEFSEILDNIKTFSKGCREDKLVSTIKLGDVSTVNTKRKDSHLSEGTPFMFSTASGKAINVDSKSLEKVRLLFKDEEGNSLESENGDKSLIINQPQKMQYKDTEPFVFTSASGKSVTVDRQILDEVKLLSRDDVEKVCDVSSYPTLPTAFSFARRKSVKVDPGSHCKVNPFFKAEPLDKTNFSLNTNDISTRNNMETNKPILFKKEQPPKPANTIVQSCFHISQEDIADLAAADLKKFSILHSVKNSSKELLANSKSDSEDQMCTVSTISVNRALFKEMSAQELTAVNSDKRRDDNPVSLKRKDDTHAPVLNILEKNYSTAENGDIFGNNSLNCIMVLINEETNTKDSNERNDVHLKYMSDNNKSDYNLKDPEDSKILCVNDRNNDSLVADVQVNFEYPEKEAIVPSYNRFKNEGTASNIHKEKSKIPDEKITLEKVRNRKSVVSDAYSDGENTQMSGMSLFHEVSESAAALLVDEQHNGTWRTRGIVTSPSMCAERTRPNVSIISLDDSQKTGFTTITNQMGNLAYAPSRVKISEKRKIYGEDKCYEYKKPKVELFTKQQIEEICSKSHQLQKEIINQKFKTVIKPETGLLFIKKQERDRISLKNKVKGLRPKIHTEEQLLTFGLTKEVICTSAHNSSLFQFDGKDYSEENIDFFSKGLQVGQESYLLFKSDSKAGLTEIQQCFLASPGVDPKLLPDEWVANHYRWIVWKLASMEKSFPEIFGRRCLNPENILQQLKYRYDREIDRAQRSAFKKISEGDESASRLFICCVAAVRNNDSEIDESTYDLELTDGWYSLWASVDQEMISLINKGKVCVGSKLAIMGAESINPDQICDPLKVIKECRLRVCTNSCRRARWDAKMGFVNSPCLSSIQLSSVLPHGGVVGKISALVSRVYPILHMSKDSEGKTVFRNERTQSVEEARYEKIYNEKAEELYEQVWREVEQKYKKNIDVGMYSKDINTLTEPDILWNIIEQTCDSATQGLLSNEQLKLVADYREQILSKMRQEVQDLIKVKMRDILPERHIIKLLKVRLVDCEKEIQALLTIWRPTEEICSILKENKIISFTYLCASGTRERVLQLTNTRQTRYQEVSSFASNKFLRRVTCLSELKPVGVTRPVGLLSSEIDVIGIVIYIKHPDHPKGLTIVYLTNLEGEYIAISFWTALKVFGCEDILTEDSLVCCYNLQWRTGSGAWRIPNVFATELSVFTQHPKHSHLKLEFSKIKSLLSFEKTTDRIAEHKLQLLAMLKKREYSSVGSGQMEYVSTSENQADITPVQKKIRKLSTCGRPPPLAPLPLFSRSPEVLQDFRSPCRFQGSPLRSLSESNKS